MRQFAKLGLILFLSLSWTKRLVAMATLLGCFTISAAGQEMEVIKVDVALVTINVAVKDEKGRPQLGLKPQDFLVKDENKPVALEFFDSDGPASIIFVVDTSTSMSGEKWTILMSGMKRFLKSAREGNDYTLIAFNESPRLIVESVGAAALLKSLIEINPTGNTALYDSLLMGLEVLRRVPRRHKALVLISDGMDNSSRQGFAEVEQEALARRATIYGLGILLQRHCKLHFLQACRGKEVIDGFAHATGGLAQFPNVDGLSDALKEISNDISSQYSLSYYP